MLGLAALTCGYVRVYSPRMYVAILELVASLGWGWHPSYMALLRLAAPSCVAIHVKVSSFEQTVVMAAPQMSLPTVDIFASQKLPPTVGSVASRWRYYQYMDYGTAVVLSSSP